MKLIPWVLAHLALRHFDLFGILAICFNKRTKKEIS